MGWVFHPEKRCKPDPFCSSQEFLPFPAPRAFPSIHNAHARARLPVCLLPPVLCPSGGLAAMSRCWDLSDAAPLPATLSLAKSQFHRTFETWLQQGWTTPYLHCPESLHLACPICQHLTCFLLTLGLLWDYQHNSFSTNSYRINKPLPVIRAGTTHGIPRELRWVLQNDAESYCSFLKWQQIFSVQIIKGKKMDYMWSLEGFRHSFGPVLPVINLLPHPNLNQNC